MGEREEGRSWRHGGGRHGGEHLLGAEEHVLRRDECSDMKAAVRTGKSPLDQDRDQWERVTGKVRVPRGTACRIVVAGI